jgi:hypothetical protein
MNKRFRIVTAGIVLVLSVPAIASCYLGIVFTFMFARLSGYNGTPMDAIFKTLRLAAKSPSAAGLVVAVLCVILYWYFFAYVLMKFVRGLEIPRSIQFYCMVMVLLVIAERIRLELHAEKVLLWFGALSVPHAAGLFSIFVLQNVLAKDRSANVDLPSTEAIA